MRAIALAIVALALAGPATAASNAPDAAVIAAAQRFFDAMAANDPAALRDVTLPGTVFTAVRRSESGATNVTRILFEDFAKNLRPGLHEAMWSPQVQIRGGMLATLSAPYEFKRDGKTTHCGIDVFNLAKVDGTWKITSLSWTQEPGACPELKATDKPPTPLPSPARRPR